MEHVPVSHRLCKTMDVLVRFEKIPPNLRETSKDCLANLLIKSLWKHQIHCEASQTSAASVYIMGHVEEALRLYVKVLPVRIKEDILKSASKLLIGNLGSVGYRSQRHTYNPLPVLIATLFEILYEAAFAEVEVYNELQWSNESRGKVLHLLHKHLNQMKEINFSCYRAPHYGFTSVPFSEKFILASCFNRLPYLKVLKLPNTCDDDILAKIAECCRTLEDLDVSGSFGVTNMGIHWFCTGTYNPNHLYHQKSDKPSPLQLHPANRVGFVPTPIAIGQSIVKHQNPSDNIVKSLKFANFSTTSIDHKGLEIVLSNCKSLRSLDVDDEIWTAFMKLFTVNEERGFVTPGCIDCVGPTPSMTDINMASNVTENLESLLYLFPNLRTLTLAKPLAVMDDSSVNNIFCLSNCLPDFRNQNNLSLKDVNFNHISPFLSEAGVSARITHLNFGGKNTVVNVDQLIRTLPNLRFLGIKHASVSASNVSFTDGFKDLKSLRLFDIHVSANDHAWKNLIKTAKGLETLYLWNIVITDEDINEIMAFNDFKCLKDVRIGCSEIGFVRLTDDTVLKLVKTCPKLQSIGGICDWKTRDLLTLLQNLMVEGGWRITLEAN